MELARMRVLLAVTTLAAPLLAGGPGIDVTPLPVTPTVTFDHNNPPAVVQPGDDGATTYQVSVSTTPFSFDFDGTNLTITDLPVVHVSATIKIFLPDNADQTLKDHENGHQELFESDYLAHAGEKAKAAFQGFIGLKFKGVGATAADRQADAAKQAEEELQKRVNQAQSSLSDEGQTLSNKYDKLTNSGTSPTVNSAQGVAQAKKEFALASLPGSNGFTPTNGPVLASASTTPLSFDPTSATFTFGPGSIDFSGAGPIDSILGSSVSISPFHLTGLLDNGSMWLSDSQIFLDAGGQSVLHGYLVNLAYMPSSLPGFAGMIQGYLDIPPDFTDAGIVNTIGSGFLADYQSALADPAGTSLSTFWFFTDQALFDSNGELLSPTATGRIVIGEAVPEPRAAILLLTCLALLACVRILLLCAGAER